MSATTPQIPNTDEELVKILETSIETAQAVARELARRKGTPLEKVCELCKGEKMIDDIFARRRLKAGDPPPEKTECFACKGTGTKVEFWPRFITGANWSDTGKVVEQYGISCDAGKFVSIRPCAEEYGDKTYLGLYLGDMATTISLGYDKSTGQIKPQFYRHNPAIFVFDLKRIIFGMESWWGEITSEAQLRKITNDDINNVWYVKALEQLSKGDEDGSTPGGGEAEGSTTGEPAGSGSAG
jgi:hypothetical protein